MTQWYVKDLSKLTGVSVQALHHYDRIDLLKPSLRLPNGYRSYSETDLLKLQQIIALKFFGFELSQIKTLLSGDVKAGEHFSAQAQFLEEKSKNLLVASQTLNNILAECRFDHSIPWETIIKLIEVYKMTTQLEKTWLGKVLTPAELKQFASFTEELGEGEQKSFEENWVKLTTEISANLKKDPASAYGIAMGKKVMDLVNGIYGKKHANLKMAVWERGFKQGHQDDEHPVSPEVIAWMDQAICEYLYSRIFDILDQVNDHPKPELAEKWKALMEELYGDNESFKQDVIEASLTHDRMSPVARSWLLKHFKR